MRDCFSNSVAMALNPGEVSASMISLMNSDVLTRPLGPKVSSFRSPPDEAKRDQQRFQII
ncbi:BnaC02g42640D [Brassica napus]|uniref:BnaC02g42640D protein n=1 Tax=Brassica napus TaxID=3708 RepID=A0A078HRC3_BRANA|nr:BnaC02g42640D [Brassica napus]